MSKIEFLVAHEREGEPFNFCAENASKLSELSHDELSRLREELDIALSSVPNPKINLFYDSTFIFARPDRKEEVVFHDDKGNEFWPGAHLVEMYQDELMDLRSQVGEALEHFSLNSTNIQFVEKEPWPNSAPFIGGCDMYPTYMVKDGVEYFMFNRRSDESAYESDRDKSCKAQLLANGGKFFRFYGYVETPYEYLRNVIERHHSFENFSHKEVEWFDDGSFCDFHGNLKEVSAAFKFRIYDKQLAANIEKIVGLIHQKKYDKALDVLNKCPNNENVKRTASLASKIESASARATESQPISHMRAKEIEPQL